MKRKMFGLIFSATLALIVLIGTVPGAILAAQTSMSVLGDIDNISETTGFPAGGSGNFIVTSRNVFGTFTSGDLSGNYVMEYKGAIDLYTQAGNITGKLSAGIYVFSISGKSNPVQWIPSTDSPTGYIGISTASGSWSFDAGDGTFTSKFSFVPTLDGHIGSILAGSTFNMTGKWNSKY